MDDLIDLVAEARIVCLQDRIDVLMDNLAVARRTQGADAHTFQLALENGIRRACAEICGIRRLTGVSVPCRKGLQLYVKWLPREEYGYVNQSVSEATPPPMPTTYPSGNQPAPPCVDTEPETHQGSEAYDASSDH